MKFENVHVNITFSDGTQRKAVISGAHIALVRRLAMTMPHLFDGTGFNPFDACTENIVAITRLDHEALHGFSSGQRKADFRLGQMDMQASVCDMLETLAKQYEDASSYSYAFLKAAAMVRTMEVPNANS